MHVRWLELAGFRNYGTLRFTPEPGLNVLVGPNGQGKTSLLEALSVLLVGRSFRTSRLLECVGWEHPEAAVGGEVAQEEQRRAVRVVLRPRAGGGPAGVELRGECCPWARVVTFAATDLALLTGMPGVRRAYLDGAAAKLHPAHAETCRRYRLVLQQRVRLLGQLAARADGERLLAPWDEQAAALGSEIVHRRMDVLAGLAAEARSLLPVLAGRGGDLRLEYVPTVAPGGDTAETREALTRALAAGRAVELRRGITLVGPHRDDVAVHLGRADARVAASRGEQRILALGLRLAEAGLLRQRLGGGPVFLLDDLLSELDRSVRERVLTWLAGQGQVLFSTTDAAGDAVGIGAAWEVRHGTVRPLVGAWARGAA